MGAAPEPSGTHWAEGEVRGLGVFSFTTTHHAPAWVSSLPIPRCWGTNSYPPAGGRGYIQVLAHGQEMGC